MKIYILSILILFLACQKNTIMQTPTNTHCNYTMPEESHPHEGTWLQWPHHYQYGITYRKHLDSTWISMTKELESSENVHIIAYNEKEKERIIQLLKESNISLLRVDFYLFKTNDTWVRDNGPIFVKNQKNKIIIEDWGFNAWGNKIDEDSSLPIQSKECNSIPSKIAKTLNIEVIDLNSTLINEGGSVEIDGCGTLMGCQSSILNDNRNPYLTQKEIEHIFHQYLGVSHFIWLKGQSGIEITDQHIDGFARFGNSKTIVTMNHNDLLEFDILKSDIDILYSATNINGTPYKYFLLPLTQKNVITSYGENLGYKGSYVNYYIANTKVLVPNYNDPNDSIANKLIQTLYPNRKVVGIDARNLYKNGGMIHCVTQQQPKEAF